MPSDDSSFDSFPTESAENPGQDSLEEGSVVEEKGFLETLMSSIVGVLFGVVFVLASCAALFWNEGRAVQTARALTEGAGLTVSVANERVDPALEGRLVHVSGPVRTGAPLRDPVLAVEATGVRLVRKVEMYQWREDSQSNNNQTTYTYSRVWSDRAIDSARFRQGGGRQNPPMPMSGTSIVANDAQIGAFRLTRDAIDAAGSNEERKLELNEAQLAALRARFPGRAHVIDGGVQIGQSVTEPRIGDLRISYSLLPADAMSVVGRQTQGALGAYTASNGRRIVLASASIRSAEAMFGQAQDDNRVFTWVIRAVGLAFLFVGFLMIMGPFTALASYIPIIGSIVSAGAMAIAFVLTLVVGLPVIAIAWFAARPLLSAALIAAGVAAFFGAKVLADRRKAARDAARAQPPAYGASAVPAPAFGQAPQGGAFIPRGPGGGPPPGPGFPPPDRRR